MLHYLDIFYNRMEATYPEITSTAAVITHGEKLHSSNLFGARDWHPALFLIVLGNQYDSLSNYHFNFKAALQQLMFTTLVIRLPHSQFTSQRK